MTAPVNRSQLLAHDGRLRALARVLVQEDAEDHVQDTYLAALSSGTEPRSIGPWMRQVLRNSVRERARRRSRRRELHRYVEPPVGPDLPEDHVADDEVARLLREVLDEVGEPYREVLELRYFEDQSAAEIARQLDIPPGTVRWRCHEGLERMRGALEQRSKARPWTGLLLTFAGPPLGLESVAAGSARSTLRLATIGSLVVGVAVATSLTALSRAKDRQPSPVAQAIAVAAEPEDTEDAEDTEDTENTDDTDDTPQAVTPPSPAGTATVGAPAATSRAQPSAGAGDEEGSADPRAEASKCAMEAIAAFNAGGGTKDELVGYLVEGANCSEDAHMLGQGIQINRALLEQYPDSDYASEAEASLGRIFSRVVDAEAGLDTEWGQDCVAPLADDESLEERLAAAQCLNDAALYGAALELRLALAADLDAAGLEANAEALETLEGYVVKYGEMGAEWLPDNTED